MSKTSVLKTPYSGATLNKDELAKAIIAIERLRIETEHEANEDGKGGAPRKLRYGEWYERLKAIGEEQAHLANIDRYRRGARGDEW